MSGFKATTHPEAKASLVDRQPPGSRWLYQSSLLGFTTFILGLSFLMNLQQQHIQLPVIGELPSICTFQSALGMDCPGCGLTRCFVSLAHGQILHAWRFNPAGLLIFGLLLYQVPFRISQIWRLVQGFVDYRHPTWLVNLVIWTIVTGLLVQWIWKR